MRARLPLVLAVVCCAGAATAGQAASKPKPFKASTFQGSFTDPDGGGPKTLARAFVSTDSCNPAGDLAKPTKQQVCFRFDDVNLGFGVTCTQPDGSKTDRDVSIPNNSFALPKGTGHPKKSLVIKTPGDFGGAQDVEKTTLKLSVSAKTVTGTVSYDADEDKGEGRRAVCTGSTKVALKLTKE